MSKLYHRCVKKVKRFAEKSFLKSVKKFSQNALFKLRKPRPLFMRTRRERLCMTPVYAGHLFICACYRLFASAAGERRFGISAAAAAFVAAAQKKKYGKKTTATADFVDYFVNATAAAATNYQKYDKQPKIAVIV